jgi:hypothetical protein
MEVYWVRIDLCLNSIRQEQLKLCGGQATRTKRSFCLWRPPKLACSTLQNFYHPGYEHTSPSWISDSAATTSTSMFFHCFLSRETEGRTGTNQIWESFLGKPSIWSATVVGCHFRRHGLLIGYGAPRTTFDHHCQSIRKSRFINLRQSDKLLLI